MLYLNIFIIFSFLGFFLESFVYKISCSNRHSGALYGPYTLVYGIGFSLSFYIYNILNLRSNIINDFIYYFLFCFISSLTELVCGYLINYIFKKDMWNYSSYKYHFTKYVCLKYFFVWGLFCALIIKLFNKIIYINISSTYTFIILFIILIDVFLSYKKSR